MASPLHSIRWRVQAWHGLILLLAVVAFCLTAYQLAWDNQLRRIDQALTLTERNMVRSLMKSLGSGGDGAVPRQDEGNKNEFTPLKPEEFLARLPQAVLPAEVAAQFAGLEPGFAYFSLRDGEGRVLRQSANAPEDMRFLPVPASDLVEETRTVGRRRELARSTAHGLRGVVGRDITPELEGRARFAWSLAAIGGGIWLLGLCGGWWLAGRAIRPIETISQTASRIAEGNLKERINTDGTDSELDQLSRVLNQTFDRLSEALERQKQFTADASHELRTPLTILLNETQRMLKRADRSPEEYRAALQTCETAAQRMRQLTESLLLLARQDSPAAATRPIALDDLLRHTLAQLQPLAEARGLTLTARLQPALCHGDPEALRVLAANLIGNAIHHHHREGGHIVVTCAPSADAWQTVLTVADDGPGISAEDLPHIFERFYRADKARSQAAGHSGLGLAMVKSIATQHGAHLEVTSTPGEGAIFEVRLPPPAPTTPIG